MKSVILTEYCWFQFWCVFKCGKKKNPKNLQKGVCTEHVVFLLTV